MQPTSVVLSKELIEKIKANHLNASSLVRSLLIEYFKTRERQGAKS